MILHGNQRGGGRDLALHLMKPENERVDVHEVRGFMADDLQGAFQESYAISKATKCKQHLYSLSISPAKGADISDEAFVDAVDQAEASLGLVGQPRAIVFHDKRGMDGELRRHAHAVWCRIHTDKMKAVELPYTKYRLRDVSRELHIQHDLKMPPGLMRSQDRDPRNFTLEEWQQCKRAGKGVRKIKDTFRECWAVSDSQAGFALALEEHGYFLAQGRRGHVAVDYKGEKYAVSRCTGIEARQVSAKLGEADGLPTIEQAQDRAARQVTDRLKELKGEERAAFMAKRKETREAKSRLQATQQREEVRLREEQERTRREQQRAHDARIRKGIMGFVDRLTGKRKRTLRQNETEAVQLHDRMMRERAETRHIQEAMLKAQAEASKEVRRSHIEAARELKKDIRDIANIPPPEPDREREAYIRKQRAASKRPRRQTRNRDGPEMKR